MDRLGKLVEDSIGPFRGTKNLPTSTRFSPPKGTEKEAEEGKRSDIEGGGREDGGRDGGREGRDGPAPHTDQFGHGSGINSGINGVILYPRNFVVGTDPGSTSSVAVISSDALGKYKILTPKPYVPFSSENDVRTKVDKGSDIKKDENKENKDSHGNITKEDKKSECVEKEAEKEVEREDEMRVIRMLKTGDSEMSQIRLIDKQGASVLIPVRISSFSTLIVICFYCLFYSHGNLLFFILIFFVSLLLLLFISFALHDRSDSFLFEI